jgi:hypothetical protein
VERMIIKKNGKTHFNQNEIKSILQKSISRIGKKIDLEK